MNILAKVFRFPCEFHQNHLVNGDLRSYNFGAFPSAAGLRGLAETVESATCVPKATSIGRHRSPSSPSAWEGEGDGCNIRIVSAAERHGGGRSERRDRIGGRSGGA